MSIMKMMNYIKSALFSASLICLASCSVADYNLNPNSPANSHPQAILPEALFQTFRHNYYGEPAIAVRQIGVSGEGSGWQTYDWGRGGFNEYSSLGEVQRILIESGEAAELQAYVGVSKIMRAHSFFHMTMLYGDVPYSAAMQGENSELSEKERFQPVYDSQKDVFVGILKELEEANTIFKNLPAEATLQGDIVYGGDLLKWRKLANSYQLRVLLMLSGKEADADLQVATRFDRIVSDPTEYPVFETAADQLALNYLNTTGVRYPGYNSMDIQSKNYLTTEFCDLLVGMRDPRLFVIADPSEKAQEANPEGARYDFASYKGVDMTMSMADVNDAISTKEISRPNVEYYTLNPQAEPSLAFGYSEFMLALAEGAARGWTGAVDAATCYNEAIKTSFDFYGVPAAEYTTYVASSSAAAYDSAKGIEQIALQRFILFTRQGDFHPLFHYHRTGFPEITCGIGQVKTAVPFRFRYPQNEINVNSVNMEAALKNQGFAEDDSALKPWIYR